MKTIFLNSKYAVALLTDGRMQIHEISPTTKSKGDLILSGLNRDDLISDASLTSLFLILSTEEGNLRYYGSDDWGVLYEHKHSVLNLELMIVRHKDDISSAHQWCESDIYRLNE